MKMPLRCLISINLLGVAQSAQTHYFYFWACHCAFTFRWICWRWTDWARAFWRLWWRFFYGGRLYWCPSTWRAVARWWFTFWAMTNYILFTAYIRTWWHWTTTMALFTRCGYDNRKWHTNESSKNYQNLHGDTMVYLFFPMMHEQLKSLMTSHPIRYSLIYSLSTILAIFFSF